MVIKEKLKCIIRVILYSWRFPRDIIYLFLYLGYWKSTWRFYGLPLIKKHPKSTIKIGRRWIACSNPKYNSLGVFQRVTIKVLAPNASLIIGENVGMSGVSISCCCSIIIGNDTLLGSGVILADSDAHAVHPHYRNNPDYVHFAPIVVGSSVFIGARAIVLKGVTIGDGAVIGAGSVVTKNVPPMKIVAGNPSKIVGDVNDEKYLKKYVLNSYE